MKIHGREIPNCTKAKHHLWKKGKLKFGESGICAKCGYDYFEEQYREVN